MFRSLNLGQLLALFLSKTGAVIVGILFLPLYHQRLGPAAFGVVAVILSIQAFALMVDFGMSVLVGRDIAHPNAHAQGPGAIVRIAEKAISTVYALILGAAMAYCVIATKPAHDVVIIGGCVLLVLFTVLQNVEQTALLADKQFIVGSVVQVGGVIFKALLTAAALMYWAASVQTFVIVQAGTTALHFLTTRHYCYKFLRRRSADAAHRATWAEVVGALSRGGPLLLAGLAGAAVLQLDKPIVSAFMQSSDVSPYFLAMSFSILPTSLLAAPVVQYFQPQVIQIMARPDDAHAPAIVRHFTLALILVVAVPSWLLWQWNAPIIALWLRHSDQASVVSHYARILLPAFALGSLCYVPVVLLIAAQDFRFQAANAILLTCITLATVFACAQARRVDWVCYTYVGYYAAASASVWWRAAVLTPTRTLARRSALTSALPVSVLVFMAATFFLVT
jgi:O-antigen/teichoic acid export membrane protein